MAANVNEIMTVGELAEYLKVSRTTIYMLAQQGSIPGNKVGKSWRFHKDAIDEWLRTRSRKVKRNKK